MPTDKATTTINAAHAAIGAAIRIAGPAMDVRELVSGVISLVITQPSYTHEARDGLVRRVLIDLVRLVGARRAHELVDEAATKGAGSDFS